MHDWREIANRLNDRGVNLDCPACGHDHLQINNDPMMLIAGNQDQTVMLGKDGSPYVIPLIALRCPRCGFLRFHEPSAVLGIDEILE